MGKYVITLEVESNWTLEEVINPSWGALIIGANHPWKVLSKEEVKANA